MKKTIQRLGILFFALVVVISLTANVFADAYSFAGASFDNRYYLEAYGTIIGMYRVSAKNSVYDLESDSYLVGTPHCVEIAYRYYPDDGGGLTSGKIEKTVITGTTCSAMVTTEMDEDIYTIRYATFIFRVMVPAASGGWYSSKTESGEKQYFPKE